MNGTLQTVGCSWCGKNKPQGDFVKDVTQPTGYRKQCKACQQDAYKGHGPRPQSWMTAKEREYGVKCEVCGTKINSYNAAAGWTKCLRHGSEVA